MLGVYDRLRSTIEANYRPPVEVGGWWSAAKWRQKNQGKRPAYNKGRKSMTPTGIALKVTNKDGRESFPCYEAFGWDKVNQIINNTLAIEHVAMVEIVDINGRG